MDASGRSEGSEICLLPQIPEGWAMASRAYSLAVDHGRLPLPGGMGDQPATFVDLCQIIDEVRSQAWDERQRETESRMSV